MHDQTSRVGLYFRTALHEMAGGGRSRRGFVQAAGIVRVREKVELYPVPTCTAPYYPGGLGRHMPHYLEDWDATLEGEWPEESAGIAKFHSICSA